MGLPLLSIICLALTDLTLHSLDAVTATDGAAVTEHLTEAGRSFREGRATGQKMRKVGKEKAGEGKVFEGD